MARTRKRGAFGTAHKLPSGRWRALYYGPDHRRYTAPRTFLSEREARSWLALRQAEIIRDSWLPPADDTTSAQTRLTFGQYAQQWLAVRDLKVRTAAHYRDLLDKHLLPAFGHLPIAAITADDVRAWHASFGAKTPTLRAHCYGLLRTIMGTAVADGRATVNPCVLRGAGVAKRVHIIEPASVAELATIVAAMPARLRAMILLASWCALRLGELCELRRSDVDLAGEVIRVRRAVVRVRGRFQVGTPKSDAGIRDVAIPPHLLDAIEAHLAEHVGASRDSLLFAGRHGQHLAPGTIYEPFYKARAAAGRDDLRFHDLRHSGAVLAAATGASLAELMARLGHSSPQAAMIYQHAARGRDREIAQLLSKLADNRNP
jgi:integrase